MYGLPRFLSRRLLERRPFPPEWHAVIREYVPFYFQLSADDRRRLDELTKLFVWEKHFFGAGGLEVTEEMKVVIATAACRIILELGFARYNRLTEIVVYPDAFRHPEADDFNEGEAHDWGVVLLSWPEVVESLADPHDAYNVVFHEFAHVIDRATGDFNGTPALHRMADYDEWGKVMTAHFDALERGEPHVLDVLDDYGAENEAEFFAVCTETYFEAPDILEEELPDLYRVLDRFYRPNAES